MGGKSLMDKMRRWLWPSVALALVIAYPLLFSTPFQQRLGALVLLYAIAASAWNIVGGYAGQVSVGHVVFFGCGAYAAMGAFAHFALSPWSGCRRCGCPGTISAWPRSRWPNWSD
jgi:branched-chain amino acid transport system permease protein